MNLLHLPKTFAALLSLATVVIVVLIATLHENREPEEKDQKVNSTHPLLDTSIQPSCCDMCELRALQEEL